MSTQEPKFINECAPIDLELCSLLGEKPSDFVVLQADDITVPGYGTPYELAKICAPGTRPVFSIAISRVCPGRSKYLHCAIRLFEELGKRVESWVVEVVDDTCRVRLMMGGVMHAAKGTSPAETICAVVALALRSA